MFVTAGSLETIEVQKKMMDDLLKDSPEQVVQMFQPMLDHFENEGWHGEIDFLIKVEGKKTNLGNFGYEVYDSKLSSFEKVQSIFKEFLPKKFVNLLKI